MKHDIPRLTETVRRKLNMLGLQLEAEGRDQSNLHVEIAGDLRVLLCDPEKGDRCPALLVLAREVGVDLRVWGPFPKELRKQGAGSFGCFLPMIVSTRPVESLIGPFHEMTAEDWLDAPIGTVQMNGKNDWYTPKELINRLSNKDGATHHQPHRDAELEALKGSVAMIDGSSASLIGSRGETIEDLGPHQDLEVRSAIIQIARWAVEASERVLAALPQPTK